MPWDVDRAVSHLRSHSGAASVGRCAHFTADAIVAGGIRLVRTGSAKDFGPALIHAGFHE